MSLRQLIEKCAKNNRKAQAQVYQLYAGKLFAVCLKYSKNKQEAEDNLQNGFITIYKKIGQFNHKGSFEGWMKRIVINTALQTYRKKSTLSIVNEDIEDIVEVDVEEDTITLDYLLALIQELPDRYRLVFSMYVLDGFSHKEIANMLEISEGTSKSNLSRARVILKQKIEEDKNLQSNSFIATK